MILIALCIGAIIGSVCGAVAIYLWQMRDIGEDEK